MNVKWLEPFLAHHADPAYIVDGEKRIVYVNDVGLHTFPGAVRGKRLDDLGEAVGWPEPGVAYDRCLQKAKTVFQIVRDPWGRALFEVTCIPLSVSRDPTEAVMVSVANVMGESLQDERFRILNRVFDSISEGVLTLDPDGRITGLNRSAAAILGLEEEQIHHAPFYEAVRFLEKEKRDQMIRAVESRTRVEVHADLKLPSRGALPCSLSLSPYEEPGGMFIGFVIILKDRTAQVEMERNLVQIEKLNALGKLVAGFAHELNNPLTSVIGFSQLLLTGSGNEAIQGEIEAIHSHARRCKKIVDNLLTFARKQKPGKGLIDVNGVVRATADLLSFTSQKTDLTIETDLAEALPDIEADGNQLQQVMVNIIENARYELKRLGKHGMIRLATVRSGERLRIEIMDNGPGIPHDVIDKIFDPFFTTKPVGEGTGLGLSLSYGIIQEMGGALRVKNHRDGGACFLIELPVPKDTRTADEVRRRRGYDKTLTGEEKK